MPYKDPERQKQAQRESAARRRDARRTEIMAGLACLDCGNDDVRVLEFHHRDPSEKAGTVGRNFNAPMEWLRAEIAKCDVLCANCHLIRHA